METCPLILVVHGVDWTASSATLGMYGTIIGCSSAKDREKVDCNLLLKRHVNRIRKEVRSKWAC